MVLGAYVFFLQHMFPENQVKFDVHHLYVTGQMLIDLWDILEELERWPAGKGVIVYGADGDFSSGLDFSLGSHFESNGDGHVLSDLITLPLERFRRLPLITVVLVDGFCLGLAADVATIPDFRLMTSTAKFGYIQTRLGMTPTTCIRPLQLMGPSCTLDLMTTGRMLSAEEAKKVGLVQEILEVTGSEAIAEARRWLESRVKGSPALIRVHKSSVLNACNYLADEVNRVHRDLWSSRWDSDDRKQHLSAKKPKTKHTI